MDHPRQSPAGRRRTLVAAPWRSADLRLDAELYSKLHRHAAIELKRVRLQVEDVEDLVNEAVLRYLEARDRVRKPESWEAWLRTAIRNLAFERVRGDQGAVSRVLCSLDELDGR